MEYQKMVNLIDGSSNQPSKFITKNVEIKFKTSQVKFKTTILRSSSCDYSDAYILVKGKITITGAGGDAAARQANERDKNVAFNTLMLHSLTA